MDTVTGNRQLEAECAAAADGPRRWRMNLHNRIIQYVSLLYSYMFFVGPYHHHSLSRWLWFAAFYVVFLFLYFAISGLNPRWHWWVLGAMFLLGFAYVPFNGTAYGVFVYPVVMSVFVLRDASTLRAFCKFAAILLAQVAAMFLEAKLLHLSIPAIKDVIFWMTVIGLSNFAYARQQLTSEQLEQANDEIERLAQSAERERIARDLHDLLGHTLTVIVIKSDLANRVFDADPEMARREIAEVEQTARKALAEVRDAVAGYRAEGFTEEVAQARRALSAAGVQLTTNIEPEVLAKPQLGAVCLALREGVTNVMRHAGATTCHLELKRDGELVTLLLEDNGKGAFRDEGSGLRGMRERLAALGGSMSLSRARDGGAALCLQLPFENAVAPVSAR